MATDAVTLLTEDHRKVEALFSRYESSSDPQEQTEIAHEVIHELAVHGEIEELIFYPALRNELPDGDSLADEAVEEHVEIKQTLNDLDSMTASDEGFDAKMAELMREVRHHVEEEEGEIFPKIREALDDERLDTMGTALVGARAMVPSRPHPNAPTSPVAKLAAGAPALALVDRVRDAVRRFADNRAGE
jgi:hemerythrin superfamily protein